MTFDDAFNAAIDRSGTVTVCGEAPEPVTRIKAQEACRDRCQTEWRERRKLPTRWQLRSAATKAVGFGPLTWLWIVAMVASLLANLKKLLRDDHA